MSELHKILAEIQQKIKVPKDKSAGNQSRVLYKYRSAEDILEKVKPLMPSGFVLTLQDEICEVGGRVYIKATAKFSDGKDEISTTAFAREPQNAQGMSEAQLTGSCSSYARKYALGGLFLLDDNKDIDEISQSPAVQKVAKQVNSNLALTKVAKQVNSNLALTNAKKAFLSAILGLGLGKEQAADFVAYYGLLGNSNPADWQNAIKSEFLGEAVQKFLNGEA